MDFLWPGLLVSLLVLPLVLVAYLWSLRRRRPSAVRYSSLSLVREALPRWSRLRRHLPVALLIGSLGALGIALARPAMILSVPSNQTTIVLAVDVSGSMCSTDIPPSRLQAAEAAAQEFVQSQGSQTQIGIVAFSGFAEVVQPPTTDEELLLDALASLQTGRRTAIGSGILAAVDAIAEIDPSVAPSTNDSRPGVGPDPVPQGAYVPDIIVVLTDGVSNAGPTPLDAAQQAADRGVRVYTIGFGTSNGGSLSPVCGQQFIGREPNNPFGGGFGGGGGGGFRRGIDEETLRNVADITGGEYYPAESASELQKVFDGLPTSLITRHEVMEVSVGFVAVGVLLAGLALLLGRAWRPLP